MDIVITFKRCHYNVIVTCLYVVAVSLEVIMVSLLSVSQDLVSPDNAMQMQHFCLMIPVDMVTTTEFPLVFSTMCQILRSLLIGYPGAVMSALASYFACLQHILNIGYREQDVMLLRIHRFTGHRVQLLGKTLLDWSSDPEKLLN